MKPYPPRPCITEACETDTSSCRALSHVESTTRCVCVCVGGGSSPATIRSSFQIDNLEDVHMYGGWNVCIVLALSQTPWKPYHMCLNTFMDTAESVQHVDLVAVFQPLMPPFLSDLSCLH